MLVALIDAWTAMRKLIPDEERPFELRNLLCKLFEKGVPATDEELEELISTFYEGYAGVMLYKSEYKNDI